MMTKSLYVSSNTNIKREKAGKNTKFFCLKIKIKRAPADVVYNISWVLLKWFKKMDENTKNQ